MLYSLYGVYLETLARPYRLLHSYELLSLAEPQHSSSELQPSSPNQTRETSQWQSLSAGHPLDASHFTVKMRRATAFAHNALLIITPTHVTSFQTPRFLQQRSTIFGLVVAASCIYIIRGD